ncbi:polysaccharide deacetylase family protein [Clostridium omnivorum]|uniref:Polysaccharide deacetylase n=1 Tax=Clostridium omnivorum TaxID=1604902 RepID=A0ABQ5N7Y8_9CLOT|nr:polysaccharide deacetylase family protein [Clostridium sp. E14]GLC31334.1 polysaccharide deacetylase [Clostridium sp. E14]
MKKGYSFLSKCGNFTIFFLVLVFCMPLISGYNKINARTSASDVEENKKVVYLTFDDGPANIVTNKILDTLKEKDIKATFFVIGDKISGREEILKRIYGEGHTIGLHTYTHKFKKIYRSEESFIEEMDLTRNEVKRVLNIEATAIRFPAGSKPHLNDSLLEKLHAQGYKIYDWNASLSDGLNYNTPPDKLYREATKVVGKSTNVVLLLHCDQPNTNTCKALPRIIDYYKEQGYEFKPIKEDTPEFYFRFKKNNVRKTVTTFIKNTMDK